MNLERLTRERPDEDAVQMAWAEWLRLYRWDVWFTGTFRTPMSAAGAQGVFAQYMRALNRARHEQYGEVARREDRVYAAMALERGPHDGRVHVHALIGGLGRHPAVLSASRQAWAPYGDVWAPPYDPRLDVRGTPYGAARYLCKHPEAVQVVGQLIKYRPRRKAGSAAL